MVQLEIAWGELRWGERDPSAGLEDQPNWTIGSQHDGWKSTRMPTGRLRRGYADQGPAHTIDVPWCSQSQNPTPDDPNGPRDYSWKLLHNFKLDYCMSDPFIKRLLDLPTRTCLHKCLRMPTLHRESPTQPYWSSLNSIIPRKNTELIYTHVDMHDSLTHTDTMQYHSLE